MVSPGVAMCMALQPGSELEGFDDACSVKAGMDSAAHSSLAALLVHHSRIRLPHVNDGPA
jgi:hypothetical protein